MFCHWVEFIQQAAFSVVVGEVWKVLCQYGGAYAHFTTDSLGYLKRTLWGCWDWLCWLYFLPCLFFRLIAPAFLSKGPCQNMLCMKCPWKPKRSSWWEYSLHLTISATCQGYLDRIRQSALWHCALCIEAGGPQFDKLVWEPTLLRVVFQIMCPVNMSLMSGWDPISWYVSKVS
jgi:hypothetical protein